MCTDPECPTCGPKAIPAAMEQAREISHHLADALEAFGRTSPKPLHPMAAIDGSVRFTAAIVARMVVNKEGMAKAKPLIMELFNNTYDAIVEGYDDAMAQAVAKTQADAQAQARAMVETIKSALSSDGEQPIIQLFTPGSNRTIN